MNTTMIEKQEDSQKIPRWPAMLATPFATKPTLKSDIRIIACISTYTSSDTLKQTLESIRSYVDHVIVIYGPYRGFPPFLDKSIDDSVDKCRDILKASKIPYSLTIANYLLQKDKRSLYLNPDLASNWYPNSFRFKEGDWLLIIDDDELFSFPISLEEIIPPLKIQLEMMKGNYASVEIFDKWTDLKSPHNRFIRWKDGLLYEPNHYTISDQNGIYCQHATPPFFDTGAKITNDPSVRSEIWKHHRALFRLLRFTFTDQDWKNGFMEIGKGELEYFTPERADELRKKLIHKVAKDKKEFDWQFMEILSWIRKGCDTEKVFTDKQRGMIAAILYANNIVPNPYSFE